MAYSRQRKICYSPSLWSAQIPWYQITLISIEVFILGKDIYLKGLGSSSNLNAVFLQKCINYNAEDQNLEDFNCTNYRF